MDMLIKLHGESFASLAAADPTLGHTGLVLRKPIGPEHTAIADWVAQHFGQGWASEVRVALANHPVSLWIATKQSELLGFACYDATARGFFGPIGIIESARGQGIGAALLRACLHDMRTVGYGYAIAGGVGAPEFFRRVAGAVEIADSTPGLYADLIARPSPPDR